MMAFLPHAGTDEAFKDITRRIDKLNDELSFVDEKFARRDQKSLERKTDEIYRDFVGFWSNTS